jgi:predicted nucleic acid-binding protein
MKISISFWDTSSIVPLCCQQDLSQQMRQLWRETRRAVVWWGTTVEVQSAISRLQDEGKLTLENVQFALDRLESLREQWREITPSDKLRAIAETLPEKYSLRALDSFQLAAALVWCNEKPRNRIFICHDEKLARAAQRAGFKIKP